MRSLNKRNLALLGVLGVAWAFYEAVTFPRSVANWAYRLEAVGFINIPIDLYTFGITQAPRNFPDWAYLRLAHLQRNPSTSVEIAKVALESGHKNVAAKLYRSALQDAGSSAPSEWALTYADLVAPNSAKMLAPLLALFRGDPASVVELAEASKAKRNRLALRLYEIALLKAGTSARPEWVAGYAEVLLPRSRNRAADLFLLAAALQFDRKRVSQGLLYIERSLAAHEDKEVLSKLTLLYLEHDRTKAEPALLRMIALGHNPHWAHHTLAMLHWDKDRLDKARIHLVEAAAAEPYRDALENFDAWRKEAVELKDNEAHMSREIAKIETEHSSAMSEHHRLSSRLRLHECDIRQFQNWEVRTDRDLHFSCAGTGLIDGLGRVAVTGFLLGLPALGRAGSGSSRFRRGSRCGRCDRDRS